MFHKLLAILLTTLVTAAAVLVVRQQRLEIAHEAARTFMQCHRHERALWTLEERLASAARPEAVRLAVQEAGGAWTPIPSHPQLPADPSVRVAQGSPFDADLDS